MMVLGGVLESNLRTKDVVVVQTARVRYGADRLRGVRAVCLFDHNVWSGENRVFERACFKFIARGVVRVRGSQHSLVTAYSLQVVLERHG